MKKIIALIDRFEQAEAVTDYAMKLANILRKELEIIHFSYQVQVPLDKIAQKQSTIPVELVRNTEALIEKRARILEKIISVKQVSVDLPFPLKFAVKQMSVYVLIRYLNKRDDIDTVIFSINNTSKIENTLSELKENLKHPLYIFKIKNV